MTKKSVSGRGKWMPKGNQAKPSGLTDKKQPPSELTDTKQQTNPQLIGKINTKKFDNAVEIKKITSF